MQREYPHVSNDMKREAMTVYGYENRDDLRLPTRLQYLNLDLPTFVAYLRDMQDWLKGNPHGEVLTMGPGTRWEWTFKNFIEIQLDGWLENAVRVGQEAVKIGGNYYSLPHDLKVFWKQLEDLQEDLPLDTILSTLLPTQQEKKTFTYEETWADQLTPPDLRTEFEAHSGEDIHAFLITIEGQEERAEALHLVNEGRMGIAWGADANWADVGDLSVEEAIGLWLNDGEEWNKRN